MCARVTPPVPDPDPQKKNLQEDEYGAQKSEQTGLGKGKALPKTVLGKIPEAIRRKEEHQVTRLDFFLDHDRAGS